MLHRETLAITRRRRHTLLTFRLYPARLCCSAKQLSSTDWVGFDLIWEKRMGIIALKDALDNHRKFEDVSWVFCGSRCMYVGSRTGASSFREMFRPAERVWFDLSQVCHGDEFSCRMVPRGNLPRCPCIGCEKRMLIPFFSFVHFEFFQRMTCVCIFLTSIFGRQATLRLGEEVTEKQPLVSVNEKFRLELYGSESPEKAAVFGSCIDDKPTRGLYFSFRPSFHMPRFILIGHDGAYPCAAPASRRYVSNIISLDRASAMQKSWATPASSGARRQQPPGATGLVDFDEVLDRRNFTEL